MTTPADCTPATTTRMRAAHHRARIHFGVHNDPDRHEVWGWRGRTLGHAVSTAGGPAWLRLAAIPTGHTDRTFFTGAVDAATAIPASVPRPRLRAHHDFDDTAWQYRAELYDHVPDRPPTEHMALTTAPTLPPTWWAALRVALDTIAAVPTHRVTIQQAYLDAAMPRMLGTPLSTTAPSWSTAHGDLHFANLCAPELRILDWEGFGLAPTGYDAAMLHTTSLLVPAVARRIRHELAHLLDTPAGRFAELVTIAELLHSTTRGDNLHLATALRDRAADLLHPSSITDAAPARTSSRHYPDITCASAVLAVDRRPAAAYPVDGIHAVRRPERAVP